MTSSVPPSFSSQTPKHLPPLQKISSDLKSILQALKINTNHIISISTHPGVYIEGTAVNIKKVKDRFQEIELISKENLEHVLKNLDVSHSMVYVDLSVGGYQILHQSIDEIAHGIKEEEEEKEEG